VAHDPRTSSVGIDGPGELNERVDDVELTITSDAATFIRGSMREVLITLVFAVSIVIATIWLWSRPRAVEGARPAQELDEAERPGAD
jgi:hypothetical protein